MILWNIQFKQSFLCFQATFRCSTRFIQAFSLPVNYRATSYRLIRADLSFQVFNHLIAFEIFPFGFILLPEGREGSERPSADVKARHFFRVSCVPVTNSWI